MSEKLRFSKGLFVTIGSLSAALLFTFTASSPSNYGRAIEDVRALRSMNSELFDLTLFLKLQRAASSQALLNSRLHTGADVVVTCKCVDWPDEMRIRVGFPVRWFYVPEPTHPDDEPLQLRGPRHYPVEIHARKIRTFREFWNYNSPKNGAHVFLVPAITSAQQLSVMCLESGGPATAVRIEAPSIPAPSIDSTNAMMFIDGWAGKSFDVMVFPRLQQDHVVLEGEGQTSSIPFARIRVQVGPLPQLPMQARYNRLLRARSGERTSGHSATFRIPSLTWRSWHRVTRRRTSMIRCSSSNTRWLRERLMSRSCHRSN